MNEYLTSLLVIFSEIGMLIALIAIVVGVLVYRREQRHRAEARQFVEALRGNENQRKSSIVEVLEKVHDMDRDKASGTAEELLKSEKRIYNDVVRIFLGHEDNEALDKVRKDVESMAKTYQRFVNGASETEPVERGDNPMHNAHMRKQIRQLENEKQKLEEDLAEAMASMENMLKEYTQMYTGGARKEGVKHIENELTQLKDKIANNVVEKVSDEDLQEPGDSPEQAGAEQDIPELKPEPAAKQGKDN